MTNKILLSAIRQYRHNNSDGFVIAYDKEEIDKLFEGYALVPDEPTMQIIANIGFNGDVELAQGHADISAEIGQEYINIIKAAKEPS